MEIRHTEGGAILWLTKDEVQKPEIIEKIENMKKHEKVAVFLSGEASDTEILEKLLSHYLK